MNTRKQTNERLVVLLMMALGLSGCGEGEKSGPGGIVTPVAYERVKFEEAYVANRQAIGEVRALRESAIGFEVAGSIEEMGVDVGSEVGAGDELARLDTERLQVRLREARAQVKQARAEEELAAATLTRVQAVRRLEGFSRQAEDEAETRLTAARAQLERAQAAVAAIEVDLRKAILRAPYAATVEARLSDLGTTVAPGQAVLQLIQRGGKEIRFSVPSQVAQTLQIGQEIQFSQGERSMGTDTFASKGTGKISRIRGQADGRTRAIDVFLEVEDNAAGGLRLGSMVRVSLPMEVQERGFWLSRQALTKGTRGLWACFVAMEVEAAVNGNEAASATHRLERMDLELLYEEAERVFVRGNLQTGDAVVKGGLQRLVAGLSVRLTNSATSLN